MQEFSWIIEPSALVRLILAVVLGGAVGWEREIHGRPAGFRTHVMVCLGATMLVLSSQYYGRSAASGIFDPDRMASGIITGIGFLGAGAIVREENIVRGLTTAGCIWFVAGLGIVIGKSDYPVAFWSTLMALVVLVFFRFVENMASAVLYQDLHMRVAIQNYDEVKVRCQELFAQNNARVGEKKFAVNNNQREIQLKFTLRLQKGQEQEKLILDLSKLPGVIEVGL
ncbi:MAG: MgtC/SapB family protein [Nitrospinae bacterium]|nr:MgtC/SapB family protein [Nitrospinota bacterium]